MKQHKFTAEDQIAVKQLTNMPGWSVLLQIMEDECEVATTRLLQSNNANRDEVIANHAMARAKYSFFEHIQKEVESLGRVGFTESRPRELTQEEILKAQFREIE